MRVSLRSFTVGLVGLGAVAVLRTIVMLGVGDPRVVVAWSDIGEATIVTFAAVFVITAALALSRAEGRTEWLLLGTGMLLFAVGDFVWAWIHLGPSGEVPYPGLPDPFYLSSYVFFASSLVLAGARRRVGADVSSATLITGSAAAAALGAVYFGLVEPLLRLDELSPGELVFSVLYPVADVALVAGPALFMTIIAYRHRDRGMLLSWGFVAAGVTLLAFTDAAFSWLSATDAYGVGSAVEYGWMVAMIALAVGASLALDAVESTHSSSTHQEA